MTFPEHNHKWPGLDAPSREFSVLWRRAHQDQVQIVPLERKKQLPSAVKVEVNLHVAVKTQLDGIEQPMPPFVGIGRDPT